MEGGRFDFDDGGSYVGEWSEKRAHGLGIATGPANQGEFSGEWAMGFESRGVYIFPSGNIYSGTWLKGKRHGEGVQVKGRWIYRGAFTTGFCGRYGVKESLTGCAKYEGSWHLNQFDGFGVETNSDGSVYSGAWSKGMRQGLGIRRSAPYSQAAEFSRTVRASQSQNSLPSGTDSERGSRGDVRGSPGDRGRTDERRSGFVLRSVSCPASTTPGSFSRAGTPTLEKKSLFRRGIFRKLRKQQSTGDLSMIGGLSSTGCNPGNLFQSRGRRTGGSLRSTLSGSSQITANAFGRTEIKGLENGGQGQQELMEENISAYVTENYSGQWNEDRRTGYGVAERSDGLRYAGEWFNNKKEGYGITYHTDGTKEEGRYKENILIQALNRKSKLFLLRHTKLRDAVEEAVRNAEDASKKANTASDSAHQRAQNAQMVANTADARAKDARKLSDEARAVAREFSPDFIQPGLQWEKKNTLLKKELFGLTDQADQSNLVKRTHLGPTSFTGETQGISGNRLEVSGGSRQGSFRSSFRRHGEQNATHQNELDHDHESPSFQHRDGYQNYGRNDPEHYRQNQQNMSDTDSAMQKQRSPAGRPMARAATTGVTGVEYAHADQRQLAQHLAQHPHSPYLMSSTSQNLNDMLDSDFRTTSTMPRGQNQTKMFGDDRRYGSDAKKYEMAHATVVNPTEVPFAHLQRTVPEQTTNQIQVHKSELTPPTAVYHAAVSIVSDKDIEPSLRSYQHQQTERSVSPPSSANTSYQHNPPTVSSPLIGGIRRRLTLPSIATEVITKPSRAREPNLDTAHKFTGINRNVGIRSDLMDDDDAVHSAENLRSESAATYIIENGIRKRVQAVTQKQKQLQAKRGATDEHGRGGPSTSASDGPRPDWTTAYDPYRPAMEGSLAVPLIGRPPTREDHIQDEEEMLPLPRTYRIESEVSLTNFAKEISMPDLPSTCGMVITADGTLAKAHGHGKHVGLTYNEISKLTQARRMELLEEMERRKRGEIVIRLADIKDWVRANFVIVFVIMINASLVFLFFNLMTDSQPAQPSTSTADSSDPVSAVSQPTSETIGSTIKAAKRIVKSVLKQSKQPMGKRDSGPGRT